MWIIHINGEITESKKEEKESSWIVSPEKWTRQTTALIKLK